MSELNLPQSVLPRWQVVRRQAGRHQQPAEGRHPRETLPLLKAQNHGLRSSVPGNDRGLALACLVDDRGKSRLCLTKLDFPHSSPP
jgi:hypothetical protein